MTIEEILTALEAGTMTELEGATALHALVDEAKAQGTDRAGYAKAALTGLIATGRVRSSIAEEARLAFEYADAMVAAESGTLPEPPAVRRPVPRPKDVEEEGRRFYYGDPKGSY